jgi:serine/threonine protein kinase
MQVESLGRYLIEKELGRGAMGRVFLAYDPQIDRRVAIKTIQIFASLPESERAQARERFMREARSAGKLLHPGIVTVFDVGEADGVPYLAMEFVEGATLDAFCSEETLLPVPDVVALVASAAEALGFAHQRGIVHRDIKPANVMRVGARAVKIMDFGLAKNPTTSMTHDGALLGTPNYMSPEQVRGEPLDGRADLFALGIVGYEMLTGAKPFSGDSISSVLYRIVNEPPKDASLHAERISAPLSGVLAKALAKNPDQRFQDGASFAAALRRAGATAATPALRPKPAGAQPVSPSVKPQPLSSDRRSRRLWFWALLAVAVIGGAIMTLRGRSAPPPPPMIEARVRTEPAGLPVLQDGRPLPGGSVRFSASGPYGVISATQGCRESKHRLDATDAGREIVLVLDPARAEVTVDPGVPGAHLMVNGQEAGAAPATLDLDLCRDNAISVSAGGYRTAIVSIPAKATPLQARNAAGGIKLEALPTGRLLLPTPRVPAAFFVDGQLAVPTRDGIELPAGTHEVRATNDDRFVELQATVDVPAGGTASPQFALPALARLVVQTFPPNCRVTLKRTGSGWRPVGETPLRYELAAGRYTLRVEAPASGESREQEINLSPGINAPIRISFGRSVR